MEAFWQHINRYTTISEAAQLAWQQALQVKTIDKHDFLLIEGTVPKKISYIKRGLLSYYYTADNGDVVIKKFFPENTLVASTSALIAGQPSLFTIQALEETELISYSFEKFRQLTEIFPDVAQFYIRYMEQHWIIEKEINEIILKYQTAKQRYQAFKESNPQLIDRLKLHHIASYLGITPTQLSRIRAEL